MAAFPLGVALAAIEMQLPAGGQGDRCALNLVAFRKEILKSLEKVAGKRGVEKAFQRSVLG